MFETIIENLKNVLHALALLGISWCADCILSTYRNVGILSQDWDFSRFLNSVKRVLVVVLGIVLLIIVVTDLPLLINETGITIPEQYLEAFNVIAILTAIFVTIAKYTAGAVEAFFNILNYKKLKEEVEDEILQSGDIEVSEIIPSTAVQDFVEFVDDSYTVPKE